MEEAFLDWLDVVEGGHELLVNLADGLRDDSIPAPLLHSFASECVQRLDSQRAVGGLDPSQARVILNKVVFDPPRDEHGNLLRFQYAAPRPVPTPGPVETFITWSKLRDLIPAASELASLIADEVAAEAFDSSDPRFLDPEEMKTVAELVTKHGNNTANFRVSNVSGTGTPFPIWMTISDEAGKLTATSRELLATRMRDWLGLGFMGKGVALFSFVSKIPLGAAETSHLLSRPTAFDGIDHGWFKHRTARACPIQWGRTLDFDPAKRGEPDCDGGPEAVAPGAEYGTLFDCRYIGELASPPMPVQPFVLKSLLHGGDHADVSGYRRELADALRAAGSVT